MIIESLLDTDLYKFTMMQTVLHQFPATIVEYKFKCRNPDIDLVPYAKAIQDEIDALCCLKFTNEELTYLQKFGFFKADFIEFLRVFQLNPRFVEITTDQGFALSIQGPWLHTILFEVPLLAIINEIYYRHTADEKLFAEGKKRLRDKIALIQEKVLAKDFVFSEFGTRRRFSHQWHQFVIEQLQLALPDHLAGTSNVYFAKQFNLTPIGTMAHEYLQACQTLGPRIIYSQQYAFERWAQEYRGELGIVLSDVYGLDAFINDFDLYFCKLFDGARHDSGDPFIWGERVISHYEKMRVDPKTKTLVFSDSLDFALALKIYQRFKDRAKIAFGIGTYLTNDLGISALQNVIKMIYCNGHPVAKVSDTPSKTMCPDPGYLAYLKQVFNIKT